ncbi:SDR family NAD(P)-dependent oxidoreductase [Mesorhizobium sp. ORM8.1]
MTDFHGRNILVTGGSGGIGGTTVRHLVKANANVIAAGRSQEALAAIAKETGCRTVSFDLGSEDDIRDALEGLDLWGSSIAAASAARSRRRWTPTLPFSTR